MAPKRHARDLSGDGARAHGGRWNRKGTPMVYASSSRALATLEYVVHVDPALVPLTVRVVTLEIPDGADGEEIAASDLPSTWRRYPAPAGLADIGTRWLRDCRTLTLRVPSAVVPEEWNILLNPLHPEMKRVRVSNVTPYRLDQRMLRKGR